MQGKRYSLSTGLARGYCCRPVCDTSSVKRVTPGVHHRDLVHDTAGCLATAAVNGELL